MPTNVAETPRHAPDTRAPSATDDTEASAPRFLEDLVHRAEQAGASDIHLQMLGQLAQIAFRLDGMMVPTGEISDGLAERVFGRVKFLARLKTYQDSLPQDGRINKGDIGTRHDLRVATYPTVTGEKIVLRLFQEAPTASLSQLGLPDEGCSAIERFLRQQSGLMLLTGPAGSGKTTTIHACLMQLAAQRGRHIITIEDPVEQIVPGIMQTEVNEARGLTFAKAARHLLRQDPQVLVIGEIRDEETANIAVRAALTGHLMISTLHAGSCRGVLERLLVLCPDRYSVSAAVELILNQRLMRRLCPQCQGAECGSCLQTGYRGRVPVAEWLRIDEAMRRMIREKGPETVQPEKVLEAAATELVGQRVTSEAEYERVFGRKP